MWHPKFPFRLGAVAFVLLFAVAAGKGDAAAFRLESPAFQEGAAIPRRHTCDGPDTSPLLRWTGPPAGTRAFALIVDDPDAPFGTWVHWVIYNLPAGARALPGGVPAEEKLPDGSLQGKNDFRRIGYGGPCPPPGPAHRYFFRLYALDGPLALPPGATKAALRRAMKSHILGQVRLMGRYGR